eukprot:1566774-Rhodomonas_salina.2
MLNYDKTFKQCADCMEAKGLSGKRAKKSETRASRPLQLVHINLAGPFRVPTQDGRVYALITINDYSCKAWLYLQKKKSESINSFLHFCSKVGGADQVVTLKAMLSNNAPEFIEGEMKQFCSENNISQDIASPHEQWQNCVAENFVRVLKEEIRVMLTSSGLPRNMWGWAAVYEIEICNEMPHVLNPGR